MAFYKIYVVFERGNITGGTCKTGKLVTICSEGIIEAIKKVFEDPIYNKYSQATITKACREF